VEAIRNALFTAAQKKVNSNGSYFSYFGNGILKANDALKVPVKVITDKTPEDKTPWFPILNTIFKAKPQENNPRMQMFNTELAQLVFDHPELAAIIDNDEKQYDKVSATKWKKFVDAVIAHPAASITLKNFLMATH